MRNYGVFLGQCSLRLSDCRHAPANSVLRSVLDRERGAAFALTMGSCAPLVVRCIKLTGMRSVRYS